ncbi:TlpA family protein disulfide reductase [Sphingobacterium pedocola]|nr:thioredoxin-like domain-containing protein [Sphingobacterium pedocola]
MNRLLILILLVLSGSEVGAQGILRHDNDPYAQSHNVFYPSGDTGIISMDAYKGKIVILDFWNRFCVSCIQQMPKLYDLQNRFANDIIILPVTADNLQHTREMYNRQKGGNYEMRLPTIYADTVLTRLFAIKGFPKAIWINRQGEFLAQTAGEAVEATMIQMVSSGDLTFLDRVATVRADRFKDNLSTVPTTTQEAKDVFSLRITPYNKYLSTSSLLQEDGPLANNKLTILNSTLLDIIKSLYSHSENVFLQNLGNDMKNRRIRMSTDVARRYLTMDSLRNIKDFSAKTEFRETQLHCVFATGHDTINMKDLKALALKTVELTFGIRAFVQPERQVCLEIKDIPKAFDPPDYALIKLENRVSINTGSALINFLNNNFVDQPLVVFANPSFEVSNLGFVLDRSEGYEGILRRLGELGFSMQLEERYVDVLRIE